LSHYLAPVFEGSTSRLGELALSHSTEYMLMGISVGGVIIAIIYAYIKYVKNSHVPVTDMEARSALAKISYNKFYFDELYNAIIQKPLDALSGFFFKVVDQSGIDGIVNGLGKGSIESSKGLRLLQTGNVGFYIFAMVIGIVAILLYSFFKF
jgi:NADH-quinone oxidoreductase subunit L